MKYFLHALLPIFSIVLFARCDDDCSDVIWDFVCHDITITLSDADGNDLLNPDNAKSVALDKITVSYKDKDYKVTEPKRALPPTWEGLRCVYNKETGKYCLLFGEFSPVGNYKKEPFTVSWGDGTQDKIEFDMYITWRKCDPTVHCKLYHNGKPVTVQEEGSCSYRLDIVKQ